MFAAYACVLVCMCASIGVHVCVCVVYSIQGDLNSCKCIAMRNHPPYKQYTYNHMYTNIPCTIDNIFSSIE